MSGSHRSGSDGDSYRGSDGGHGSGGGYRQDGGGYGAGRDEYERYSSGRSGSGPYQRETGPYETGPYETGPYETGSGGYRTESGGYQTSSGGYRTESGGYRTPSGSYRAGSGGYRTGSHRVVRENRTGRRWAAILGGAIAVVGVCVLAAFVILSGVGGSGDKGTGQVVGSGATESSPMSKGERASVPDSCTILGEDLIARLAPDSERNEADNYQGDDQQNQCVWGAYAGEKKRQLTLELRAIAGGADQSPTAAARKTFTDERTADESGKALLAGQKLTDKLRLNGVGDEGYIVYSVDGKQGSGEAIGNVRLGNVLVTIHYSGSDDGDPLSSKNATGGATEIAKTAVAALNQG
ncbi:hypothetical protein E1293_42875 [Actinomadura darangshiensis]|uniref:DUF3558 domain-containing protein n=1 Tax=Actinomadura darangshiensis TaxID=705336 RepID=A0A4R4ZZM1_9ACTN|nr:hypothetical protein [Actinomadura darangshiensis]TDD63609.1 hypothetical protein E1293_42875 [Actinomadura darangshiensis]